VTLRTFLSDILPGCNAVLNATSAVLLLLGYVAIRFKRVGIHLRLMLAALTTSAVFLAGYLTRMALTGTHRFPGEGAVRNFYFVLLFTHMVLAVALLPLIGRTLYLAAHQRFAEHRAWARVTWPVWMYVSVTGVIVYWMLYHLAPRLVAQGALAPM
jgi:putative membrane protein